MCKLFIDITVFLSLFVYMVRPQQLSLLKTPPTIAFPEDIKTGLNVRVIGGQPVTPHSYPFVVALNIRVLDNTYFCGGTLVTTEWILTAAHCVDQNVTQINADLGVHQLSSYTERIPVSHIILHKEWNETIFRHDIALLKLSRNATLSNTVQPLNVLNGTSNISYDGQTGTIIGWGQTENGTMANVLKSVDAPVISNLQCNSLYGIIVDGHMCVSGVGNRGACNGDSGGPLMVNGIQVGLVSFGATNCSAGYPTGFTRISAYTNWIAANMKGNAIVKHLNKPAMIILIISLLFTF